MKKVFLGVGHGGSDSGAVANGLKEKEMNLVMALACKAYLEANGVNVGISRTRDESDPVSEEIREANAFAPDIAVDCHNNAGGGDGFEILVQTNSYRSASAELGKAIETEVKKIGQNSRGIKTRLNSSGKDYYGFLRCVDCPAVIAEGCFLDSADRMIADTQEEQRVFGVAYAKGILSYLGAADGVKEAGGTNIPPQGGNAGNGANTKPYTVKITATVLNVRKGPGVNYPVTTQVKKGEVYTIVEEEKKGASVWGKLKSGAGYISLAYTQKR